MPVPSPDRSSISVRIGGLLTAVITLAVVLIELVLPFSWDNSVYQSMGWDLHVYGKIPFLGSWDVNFPGIVYLHALVIALLGRSDIAFRSFDVIVQVLTAWCFYRLLVRWFRPSFALVSAVLYELLYVSLTWSVAGQRDAFVPLLLFSGLILFYKALDTSGRNGFRFFTAGFLISLTFLIRPTYLLLPVAVVLAYAFTYRIDKRIIYFNFGLLASFLLLLLPYTLHSNGLRDFWRFAIQFNLDLYSPVTRSLGVFFFALQSSGVVAFSYTLLGLIAVLITHYRKPYKSPVETRAFSKFDKLLYLFLILSSLISIFFLRTFQADHYLLLLALLSPLMAFGILAPMMVIPRKLDIVVTAFLLLYVAYRLYPRDLVKTYIAGTRTSGALGYVYRAVDNDSLCGYEAEAEAVNYLKAADSTREPVEVICYNRPYLRVKAGLESATRFSELLPLAMKTRQGITPITNWNGGENSQIASEPRALASSSWPITDSTSTYPKAPTTPQCRSTALHSFSTPTTERIPSFEASPSINGTKFLADRLCTMFFHAHKAERVGKLSLPTLFNFGLSKMFILEVSLLFRSLPRSCRHTGRHSPEGDRTRRRAVP